MRRAKAWIDSRDESGSAALEFIVVGMLLLVPLVYLVITLGTLQGHTLGVESGARHIARAIALAADVDDADERADAVLRTTISEYGLEAESLRVRVSCHPATAVCPSAGATVIVTVSARVSLPLVPPVLGLQQIASMPVEASAVQKVSRFWGAS